MVQLHDHRSYSWYYRQRHNAKGSVQEKKLLDGFPLRPFKVPPITNPRTSILFAVQNVRISYCYVQPYGTGNYHHLPSLQWETIKFCRGRASRNAGTMWNWTCTFQISEPKSIKIHISPQAFPMRLLELWPMLRYSAPRFPPPRVPEHEPRRYRDAEDRGDLCLGGCG